MSNQNELIKVKIFRFDPTVDHKPRYESYQVPYEGYSVLNVLQYIYEHYDPGLSYRAGCLGKGSGRCRVCPVMVNGVPVMSCQKAAEGEMIVEPHPKFELIKDLAVDFKRVKRDWNKILPTVSITVDEIKCIGCNDCIDICPVGVLSIKKVNGKNKTQPTDVGSCCGILCKLCELQCGKNAITIMPVGGT